MIKRKVHIAFFVPSLDGGIGRVISLLAIGLQEVGKKVEIWSATPKNCFSNNLAKKVKIRYLGNGRVSSSFFPLLKQLNKNNPETLLSASFHTNCVAIISSFFSKKSIQFIISDHPSIDASLKEFSFIKKILWKFFIFFLYPFANKHIAVSKGVASAMSKYGNVKLSKISIIPNPVIDKNFYKQANFSISHPFLFLNEPILLFVGRLSHEKDIPNILNAFKIVIKAIPSRLLIIGEGPERQKLEKIVDNLQINQRVSFLGYRDNPYPYFVQSDLLILSSKREGLPTVIIEALAFGLKVVSTDCPSGPSEILNNGKYGHLVKVGDSEALANSVLLALKSSKPKIPKTLIKKYSVKSVVKSYKNILS